MGLVCSSSISIFDRHAEDVTATKLSEGTMLACPNINKTQAVLTDTKVERNGFEAEIKVDAN